MQENDAGLSAMRYEKKNGLLQQLLAATTELHCLPRYTQQDTVRAKV